MRNSSPPRDNDSPLWRFRQGSGRNPPSSSVHPADIAALLRARVPARTEAENSPGGGPGYSTATGAVEANSEGVALAPSRRRAGAAARQKGGEGFRITVSTLPDARQGSKPGPAADWRAAHFEAIPGQVTLPDQLPLVGGMTSRGGPEPGCTPTAHTHAVEP